MPTYDSYLLQESGFKLLLEDGSGSLILETAVPVPDVATAGGGGKLRRRRTPTAPPQPKPTPPLHLNFDTARVYVYAIAPNLSVSHNPTRAIINTHAHRANTTIQLDASMKLLHLTYHSPVRAARPAPRLTVEDVWTAVTSGRSANRPHVERTTG